MSPVLRRLARLVLVAALLALAAIGFLTRDGFRRWPTSEYPVTPSSYRTWDEVFAHPAPVIVETLVTGFIDMNRCDNLDPSNAAVSSCRSPEPLQDLVHLIRHARLGVYLIDSGFGARFADSPPYGNYSLAMQLFNRALGVRNGALTRARPRSCASVACSRAPSSSRTARWLR